MHAHLGAASDIIRIERDRETHMRGLVVGDPVSATSAPSRGMLQAVRSDRLATGASSRPPRHVRRARRRRARRLARRTHADAHQSGIRGISADRDVPLHRGARAQARCRVPVRDRDETRAPRPGRPGSMAAAHAGRRRDEQRPGGEPHGERPRQWRSPHVASPDSPRRDPPASAARTPTPPARSRRS